MNKNLRIVQVKISVTVFVNPVVNRYLKNYSEILNLLPTEICESKSIDYLNLFGMFCQFQENM